MKNISIARPLAIVAGLAVAALALPLTRPAAAEPAAQFGRLNIGSQQKAQDILTRIRTDAGSLRRLVTDADRAANSGRRADREDTLYRIDDLIQEADSLHDRVTREVFMSSELDGLFGYALELDRADLGGKYGPEVTTAWNRVRRDVDDLAAAYDVDWNWERMPSGVFGSARATAGLGGTYELSESDSDTPRAVADRVLADVPSARRASAERQIENRLTPPEKIAIEQRGESITVASTTGPRVSFDANGEPQTDTGAAGRRVTTRASTYGDRVEVTQSGSNGADFTVTFEPLDNGRTMRVTRRLYTEDLQAPVTVRSIYHRTATNADWSVYGDDRRAAPRNGRTSTIVPSGTTVVATLDQTVDGRAVREGDRVTLTVSEGPAELRNGVIQGSVTSDPERVNNRTGLSIDFESIRLRNGRTADFDGTIDNIRDPNGRDVAFDRPGADDDRTEQAVQRGAVGAALGAVIGAVIGGGKGAAIGAAVGAGGGAGTVLLDDRTGQLPRGTEFTIRTGTVELQ